MKKARSLAFTLIELLVVISIIGILAALALPAITGALTKGQMTQTLSNMKQLHLATFNMNLENETVGLASVWPGSNVTFVQWRDSLTNSLSESDMRKLFSAPRVSVTNAASITMAQTALNVYQVGNIDDNATIFLSTKNFNAVTPTTLPTATAVPYGNNGFILMRRGGDGQIIPKRIMGDTNASAIPTNQPALAL